MSVDWSPTGREFVSGSYDRTVRIWSHSHGRSRDVYHTKRMQRVFSTLFTLDARFVVTGSDDGGVRLWKARSGESLGVLSGREKAKREYGEELRRKWKNVEGVGKLERCAARPPSPFTILTPVCTGNATCPSRSTAPTSSGTRCSRRGRRRKTTGGRIANGAKRRRTRGARGRSGSKGCRSSWPCYPLWHQQVAFGILWILCKSSVSHRTANALMAPVGRTRPSRVGLCASRYQSPDRHDYKSLIYTTPTRRALDSIRHSRSLVHYALRPSAASPSRRKPT